MTDNRIDFEDCNMFVRIDDLRIAKAHIVSWRLDEPDAPRDLWLTVSEDGNLPFHGCNAAEVLEALGKAMRGAR